MLAGAIPRFDPVLDVVMLVDLAENVDYSSSARGLPHGSLANDEGPARVSVRGQDEDDVQDQEVPMWDRVVRSTGRRLPDG